MSQETSEATYTGYARVAVARSEAGWTVSGTSGSNAAIVQFALNTGADQTVTHFGIGTADSGAGKLLYSDALTAPLVVRENVDEPKFAIGALAVNKTGDIRFPEELLKLILQNVDVTLIGDAGGLRGSVAAGSLYVSLHTANPAA